MTTLIDYGVKIPISGILRFKGCFVAEIEGYALSAHDSADLYTVCLVAPRESGNGIGPEIEHPMHATPGSLERIIADVLWKEAEAADTRDALAEAWAEHDDDRRVAAQELRAAE